MSPLNELVVALSARWQELLATGVVASNLVIGLKTVSAPPMPRIITSHEEMRSVSEDVQKITRRVGLALLVFFFTTVLIPFSSAPFLAAKAANVLILVVSVASWILGTSGWVMGIGVYARLYPGFFKEDFEKMPNWKQTRLYMLMWLFLRNRHPLARLPTALHFTNVLEGSKSHTSRVQGIAEFCFGDFADLHAFAMKLTAKGDPVSGYLWQQCSHYTRLYLEDIAAGRPTLSGSQLEWVLDDLNRLIRAGQLNESLFTHVSLSTQTRKLLAQRLDRRAIICLNRLLLEDAYPLELNRARHLRDSVGDEFHRLTPRLSDEVEDRSLTLGFVSRLVLILTLMRDRQPKDAFGYDLGSIPDVLDQVRDRLFTFGLAARMLIVATGMLGIVAIWLVMS